MSRISIRYHLYMDFSMKTSKKELDTQMSWIKHPMSFLSGFFHENVKKKLDTQMSQIKHPMSVLYWIFPWKRPKKARYPNVKN